MKILKILVACEYSGVVRDAFINRGHDAVSCDLLPTESPLGDTRRVGDAFVYTHHQGDVLDYIDQCAEDGRFFDLMIAHPPCTYLSVSGMHRTTRGLRDPQLTEDALDFVRGLASAPIPHIAIENPVSVISTRIRKPNQIINPWQFGHDASKKTCLWLKNLPLLTSTSEIAPRIVDGKKRWANQTDSGQNRLPPSADRWKLRSATYPGIAEAMAQQWGDYIRNQRTGSDD